MTDETIQHFANVWDALASSPEEAASLRLRSDLAIAVRAAVESWKLTQGETARRLGIPQPRLNDLLRGRLAKFSLEALIGLAERSGLSVRMEILPSAALASADMAAFGHG